MVLNAVCSACNAGWLNQLEDLALPALVHLALGLGPIPSAEQLHDFAFWAVIRALLRTQYSSGGRAPSTLFHAAYEHRETRQVPLGCVVSIAQALPAALEGGTHQSARLPGGAYLGHVATSWGSALISVMLADRDLIAITRARRAADQQAHWFPGSFRRLAPFPQDPTGGSRRLLPDEAQVAASLLGFLLHQHPCDQFGNRIHLEPVVPPERRGEVPWPGARPAAPDPGRRREPGQP